MLRVSFDFNETTNTVSNVTVEEVGKSKARGVLTTSLPTDGTSFGPDVEVLENKLQLSKPALFKLNAKADDRISVQYISEGIGKSSPLIAKAEKFTDRNDGNRLTNKGTVSFRGEKRNTLIGFGTAFTMQEFKDGIWKLIPYDISEDSEDSLAQEELDAESLNNSEIEKEIEELTASTENDLPF